MKNNDKQTYLNLIKELEVDPISESTFTELLCKVYNLVEWNDSDAAKYLVTSRPTIQRWREGRTHPYHLVRRSIFNLLIDKVQENVIKE